MREGEAYAIDVVREGMKLVLIDGMGRAHVSALDDGLVALDLDRRRLLLQLRVQLPHHHSVSRKVQK